MTSSARTTRMLAVAVVVHVAALCLPAPASAQFFVYPFAGYNFGGDSGCPEITACDDRRLNWGISVGAVGRVVGIELFGKHVGARADVRYFHSFNVLDVLGLGHLRDNKLDFGRFSGGVVFKF
jgi:hypothetical protein